MFTIFVQIFLHQVLLSASVILIYMTGLFFIALMEKKNDVADVGWGIGFIAVAVFTLISSGRINIASSITTILIVIWGSRLALHIYRRNKGKQEDFRYRQWREEWGRWFVVRSYLQVFLLQGFLMLLISLPVILVNSMYIQRVPALVIIGALVWLFGFIFESIGDKQLSRFIANPSNKGVLMTTGLWSYTRHPNYFGEVTQWWGIFLIACAGLYGWITIIGPLTITFLILKVSGVPLLERSLEKNPAFAEYKRRTSKFIPLPPRRN
jgi:steroid 5-alpha reductase family enzyme